MSHYSQWKCYGYYSYSLSKPTVFEFRFSPLHFYGHWKFPFFPQAKYPFFRKMGMFSPILTAWTNSTVRNSTWWALKKIQRSNITNKSHGRHLMIDFSEFLKMLLILVFEEISDTRMKHLCVGDKFAYFLRSQLMW